MERAADWREEVLRPTIGTMVAVGLPLLGLWVWRQGEPLHPTALVAGAGLLVLLGLLVRRAPPRHLGAAGVLVAMSIGLTFTLTLGLRVGPLLVTSLGVVLAGAVFGRAAAGLSAGFAYAWLLVTGWAISVGALSPPDAALADESSFSTWARGGLAATGVAMALGVLVAGVVRSLERSLTEQQRALDAATRAYRARIEAEERRTEVEHALANAARMEALGRLAGGVAHDFNNLLQLIGLTVEDLKARSKDPGLGPGLDSIEAAVGRAGGLTRRLLTMGRRTVRTPVATVLGDELPRLVEPWRRVLPDDIRLVLDLEADVEPVRVDVGELDQLVLNLLLNARDAMPNGGEIRLSVRSASPQEVPPELEGSFVRLAVQDGGVGMDEATLAQLWEPFFTTKDSGTGLGLPMVRILVESMGGAITVASSVGAGTEFQVFLPHAGPSDPPGLGSAPPLLGPEVPPGLVLVVEDEPDVLAQEVRVLTAAGYEVLAAESADVGLALALPEAHRLQVVVTDGVMDGMPVSTMVGALREIRPELPVLVCSGHLEEDLLRRGVTSGDLAFLSKPFQPKDLVQTLRRLAARGGGVSGSR